MKLNYKTLTYLGIAVGAVSLAILTHSQLNADESPATQPAMSDAHGMQDAPAGAMTDDHGMATPAAAGEMADPHGMASPAAGAMANDHGMATPAAGAMADDHGMATPAAGAMTDDHGMATPAAGAMADDHGMATPSTGMMTDTPATQPAMQPATQPAMQGMGNDGMHDMNKATAPVMDGSHEMNGSHDMNSPSPMQDSHQMNETHPLEGPQGMINSAQEMTPDTQAQGKVAREVTYGTVVIDGLKIAYREAGNPANPKLVLLHGFPASSHQYRDLIPALADQFHVIAPDYPGFGNSDAPDPATYNYTFDKLSEVVESFLQVKGFDHYGLFVQDYGGPVGFRVVGRHPQSLDWLIVQNSNAYEEGFSPAWDGFRKALWIDRNAQTEKPLEAFLTHDGIRGIYTYGAQHPELISPDNWEMDSAIMQRPNSIRINLDLFYDYRTNVPLYPQWQSFLRDKQPKTLIFWGQSDPFFTAAGGEAYLKDLPQAEMHRLEAGHFAVEDNLDFISQNIHRFYNEKVASSHEMSNHMK